MRTDKELLKILLEATEYLLPYPCGGLSRCIFQLRYEKVITSDEKRKLHNIIENNKPFKTKSVLWWEANEVKARIEFLKILIKKYEKS